MKEVYILNYYAERIYHFSIDLSDYLDVEKEVVEREIEGRGFNIDDVSYIITDNILKIEEV